MVIGDTFEALCEAFNEMFVTRVYQGILLLNDDISVLVSSPMSDQFIIAITCDNLEVFNVRVTAYDVDALVKEISNGINHWDYKSDHRYITESHCSGLENVTVLNSSYIEYHSDIIHVKPIPLDTKTSILLVEIVFGGVKKSLPIDKALELLDTWK